MRFIRRYVAEWDRAAEFLPVKARNTQRLIVAPMVVDGADHLRKWLDLRIVEFRHCIDLVSAAESKGIDPGPALFVLRDSVRSFLAEIEEAEISEAS
ncbi:hypothetical protein LX90_003734 [Lentzea flava]|nr:hypothetical protein [Lentzea flava]